MKLSIVIPVYQVEEYVEKCLKSCIEQNVSTDEFEIIIVNDGSKDNSLQIVERVIKGHHNITLVSQENSGLSIARNNGLALAKGEFVWFIDSDDWIEERCLERILPILKEDVDICQLSYRLVYDEPSKNIDLFVNNIISGMSGKDVTIKGGLPAPAQFCIYKRSFLLNNNLKFVPGILHEDIEFKPRAVYLAKKIVVDRMVSYNYYQRCIGSITSSFSLKRVKSYLEANNSLYMFSRPLAKQYRRAFYRKIAMNMNTIFDGYKSLTTDDQVIAQDMIRHNKHLIKCMIKSRKLKYVLEGSVLILSVHCGLFCHSLIKA